MSQVIDPDATNLKQIASGKAAPLRNIKTENVSHSDESDYDDDEDFSQAPRPQQFYQELDNCLENCTRDEYVSELIKYCKNDFYQITDYRERLAERARGFPECPQSRLINRRNSSHATRETKCAHDCYILFAFVNGERTREIQDVFTSLTGTTNETVVISDDQDTVDLTNQIIKPDIYAMLSQMQGQITDISLKQQADSHILEDLRSDVARISLTFRTFHGTLNSILSRMPEKDTTSQITSLQSDVTKLSSTIAVMNKRFLDKPLEQITDKEPGSNKNNGVYPPVRRSYSATVDLTKTNDARVIQDASPAKVIQDASPAKVPSNSQNISSKEKPDGTRQKSVERVQKANETENYLTILQKSNSATAHKSRDSGTSTQSQEKQAGYETTTPDAPAGKFIAARRRKITSYFIGNIDASVSESDVRDYLKDNDIKPTHMTMFYGKNGSSARLNIYFEDESKVESDDFWPEGVTCRRWVSKSEWENERQQRRDTYRNKYSRYRRNNSEYDHDKNNETDYRNNIRDNDFDKYDYSEYRNSDGTFGSYRENDRRYYRAQADREW